ncbi:unnamed protein product [Paramecium primaurelia]|uniref:protein-serine/threonine phosphatase n=1 Tax=Paramecium primaurelia TaxID=5886 RepID=A0A8S1MHJ4_PARPR|nr:unnamed protein product [Paramecium primaurelia]
MGAKILIPPDRSKNTCVDETKYFIYASSAMQGWKGDMEDVHIHVCDFAPDISLFGVFDGHGGNVFARFVQKHFIEELEKNKNFKDHKFEDALIETFLKMDELLISPEGQNEINEMKDKNESINFAGTTANVALFYKNTLYVANVGDSRSVLCRENTNYDMSFDHIPNNYQEKLRIQKAGGYVSDGRINGSLNLSRSLGDFQFKSDTNLSLNEQLIIALPDIKKVELTQKDKFLLMGCDGIFETLDHSDLLKFINQKLEDQIVTPQFLGKVAEDLLDALIAPDLSAGTGCDNMTILIIYFK